MDSFSIQNGLVQPKRPNFPSETGPVQPSSAYFGDGRCAPYMADLALELYEQKPPCRPTAVRRSVLRLALQLLRRGHGILREDTSGFERRETGQTRRVPSSAPTLQTHGMSIVTKQHLMVNL